MALILAFVMAFATLALAGLYVFAGMMSDSASAARDAKWQAILVAVVGALLTAALVAAHFAVLTP